MTTHTDLLRDLSQEEKQKQLDAQYKDSCLPYAKWVFLAACTTVALAFMISGAVLMSQGAEIGLPLLITGCTLLALLCCSVFAIATYIVCMVCASAGGK